MNEFQGTFIDWHLKLWGESIDPDKATLLPMPTEEDDDDHDEIKSTVEPPVATTSLSIETVASQPPHILTKPTDHPERPTKPTKPTDEPVPTGTEDEEVASTSTVAQESTETPSSSWVSWLPSFGASKKAQIWIYGAVGLIVVFCIGLGVYLFVARRRQRRNDPRNTYEFELLDEEETEGLNSGEKNLRGKKGRRTRGGELYDAFAGGSDDDDLEDAYRDRAAARMAGDEEEQYVIGEESDDDADSINEKGESRPLGGGH